MKWLNFKKVYVHMILCDADIESVSASLDWSGPRCDPGAAAAALCGPTTELLVLPSLPGLQQRSLTHFSIPRW